MRIYTEVLLCQAALGEKKNNGSEPVRVYLKVGDKKLVIGTLSHEKLPQLSTEIVLEKPCELSHSWKNGSVYFSGYRVDAYESYPSLLLTYAVIAKPYVLVVDESDLSNCRFALF